VLDGQGSRWWGLPGIGYLERMENRPKLLEIRGGTDILVEKLLLKDSAYWTFWAHGIDGLEVRFTDISARRTPLDEHDIIDLTAFNTDGFDVSGNNVWIHDCSVWNQDDCIAVKGGTNMLFERIEASGVGLTIGSIGASIVRNITFRDCVMHKTYKGIYLKFNGGAETQPGLIENVLYENIHIYEPEQWPIWIGPAQQADSRDVCHPNPCSLCWPTLPFSACSAPSDGRYNNITLRNVTIIRPKMSPGVIMGPSRSPMTNITFEDVRVVGPGWYPWGDDFYHCEGVASGIATGATWPVPPCFRDHTTSQREHISGPWLNVLNGALKVQPPFS